MSEETQAPTETQDPLAPELVYDSVGKEYRLIEIIRDGAVAAPILTDDEGNEYEGDPRVLAKYFRFPPRHKKNEEIAKLDKQINALTQRLVDLRNKKPEADREIRELCNLLAAVPVLRNLKDFIDGKITHYVLMNPYNGPEIAVAPTNDEHGGIQLLSLFGKSEGDISWRVNRWSDGSSGSSTECVPCRSHEEAMAEANRVLESQISQAAFLSDWMIEKAKRFGVSIPQDKLDAYYGKAMEAVEKEVQAARELLAKSQTKLAVIAAEKLQLTPF